MCISQAETASESKKGKELSQDVVKRNSVNFTNVRVNKELEKFKIVITCPISLLLQDTVKHRRTAMRWNGTIRSNTAWP